MVAAQSSERTIHPPHPTPLLCLPVCGSFSLTGLLLHMSRLPKVFPILTAQT